MIDKFRQWYTKYYTEITWFIIGWVGLAALYDFSRGDWLGLLLDLAIIAANIAFWKK